MKQICIFITLCLFGYLTPAQNNYLDYKKSLDDQTEKLVLQEYEKVKSYFLEAYGLYPTIPRGVLEAVAFSYSRFHHLIPEKDHAPEGDIPATYGVMGLTLDGKGYFRDNMKLISQLSGTQVDKIIQSARDNILAYACAYAVLQKELGIYSNHLPDQFPILDELSELPKESSSFNDFVLQSQHYAYCLFINDDFYREMIDCSIPKVDTVQVFGRMLPLLHAPYLILPLQEIHHKNLNNSVIDYKKEDFRDENTDYSNAIWNPAGTCNYSSRNGRDISAITIHYTDGTYAGSISWFQNCTYNGVGSRVSAHYVLRSIDGQVTQMVRETDKAWHVGNCNPYTIGIEHEAYGDVASFFTSAMYESSAALTRDICERNGIPPTRMFYRDTLDDGTVLNYGTHDLGGETSCIKIKGHQHFPGQSHTDPGRFWNWNYYFKLVNHDTPVEELHTSTGTFTDSGGEQGNYGNDERRIVTIQVPDAEDITLSFSQFDLEDNYDFLWIYDGNSVFAPLIGRWNTTSPGTVTSSGNALTIEFRSDCATTAAGWIAQWSAHLPITDNPPTTAILHDETDWVTESFNVSFDDNDDHGVDYRFYQVMGNDGIRWTARGARGFACDNFDDFNPQVWNVQSGQWSVLNHRLTQAGSEHAVISTPLRGDLSEAYLYDFYAAVGNGENEDSYMELILGADRMNPSHNGSAYSIRIYPTSQKALIYRWINGDIVTTDSIGGISTESNINHHYRILHDHANGILMLYRDSQRLLQWQDPVPLAHCGMYAMLSTSGLSASFDNWRVYRSRLREIEINVGTGDISDAPWEASNGNAGAKIKSIVMDDAGQFSPIVEKKVKIDVSTPLLSGNVEPFWPIQELSTTTPRLTLRWPQATDPNSNIASYEYIIHPSNQPNTIIRRGSTQRTEVSIPAPMGERRSYIAQVRAFNQAGLPSGYIFSRMFSCPSANRMSDSPTRRNLVTSVVPNPAHDRFTIFVSEVHENLENTSEATSPTDEEQMAARGIRACIYDAYGRKIMEKTLTDSSLEINASNWSSGMYILHLYADGERIAVEKIFKD